MQNPYLCVFSQFDDRLQMMISLTICNKCTSSNGALDLSQMRACDGTSFKILFDGNNVLVHLSFLRTWVFACVRLCVFACVTNDHRSMLMTLSVDLSSSLTLSGPFLLLAPV